MHPVPITALYGALNAFLYVALGARIVRLRWTEKVSIGTGDSKTMLHAVRVHANNAENVPLALIMMLLCELSGGKSVPLHVLGGILFCSRISHAFGLPRRAPNVFRIFGMCGTWGVILAGAIYALVLRGG